MVYREGPKRVVKPLEGLTFAVCGKDLSTDKKQVTEQVKELGGKVGSSVTANTAAVITTKGIKSSLFPRNSAFFKEVVSII